MVHSEGEQGQDKDRLGQVEVGVPLLFSQEEQEGHKGIVVHSLRCLCEAGGW